MHEYAKIINIINQALSAHKNLQQAAGIQLAHRSGVEVTPPPRTSVDDTSLPYTDHEHFHALDATLKNQLEQAFDADFSNVRIHYDHFAHQLTRNANADALTIGSDIYFADGKYAPESEEGIALLAHELEHIVQNLRSERFVYLEEVANAEAQAEATAKKISSLKLHQIKQPLLKQPDQTESDRGEKKRNEEEAAADTVQFEDMDGGLDDFMHRRDYPLIRVLTSGGGRYELTRQQYRLGKEEIKRLFNEHLQEMRDSKSGSEYAAYMQKVLSYLQHI